LVFAVVHTDPAKWHSSDEQNLKVLNEERVTFLYFLLTDKSMKYYL